METKTEPRLGCKVWELEVGTEFSMDEGFSWLVVMTEPKYTTDFPGDTNTTMRFMAAPSDDPCLATSQTLELDDNTHVLLERGWGSTPK